MNMLLDGRGEIQFIDNIIEFGVYDEPLPKWKIGGSYALDDGYELVEEVAVPIEVIPHKYFYLEGEFVLNPNYKNDSELREDLNQAGIKIVELQTQLENTELSIVENDFRLCVLEMGF